MNESHRMRSEFGPARQFKFRRPGLWLLILLGLAACNLPVRRTAAPAISVEDLRLTLAAYGTQTEQAPSGTPATPSVTFSEAPIFPTELVMDGDYYVYRTLPGDTLLALAARFGVTPEQILSDLRLPDRGFLPIGRTLRIPDRLDLPPYPTPLLPDTEIVHSPSTVDFDIADFVGAAGGYLKEHRELVKAEQLSGVEIVERVALESAVNPRFLLALIEHRSGWVYGPAVGGFNYPIGFHVGGQTGLYRELVMSATHLNLGYYGWRYGTLVEMKFQDGQRRRLSPQLNAGSVAVQSLFSKLYDQAGWEQALYGQENFRTLYERMFGDPWVRAAAVEPVLPPGLAQPALLLPFAPGERWSLTAGPHPSWKTGSPRGALDFAPVTGEPECSVSRVWALAAASGFVARSERNVVAIDLDGDGFEQTGWVLVYLHLADHERVPAGRLVQPDEPVGHPSCEGGTSTGTHLHIARKYNGEWIAADGPLPFVLDGWQAYADARNYYGGLRKEGQLVVASPVGPQTSIIVR